MQLLISDANILIDLEEGQLIETVFSLPYQFSTPDMLFYDELEEQHSHLLDLGLQLGDLTEDSIDTLQQLVSVHTKPSRYDCMALVLAQQEQCPLLTGDKELRASAKKEGVEVRGTIWLVERMIEHNLISISQALDSYQRMEENGRRLPFKLARKQLIK